MTAIKTEAITVHIESAVKEGLNAMAEYQRSSLNNMIEVMICQYCAEAGVRIIEAVTHRAEQIKRGKEVQMSATPSLAMVINRVPSGLNETDRNGDARPLM